MASIDRRSFLRVATTAVAAGAVTPDLAVDSVDSDKGLMTTPVQATPEVTKILARYIVSARYEDLSATVRKEGLRTLLNWIGVAVGGSRHETVSIAAEALAPFSGPPQASILGRRERFDVMNAAFINGVSSHIFDYDDTHLKTIIHPAGPVVAAILALAEFRPIDGRNFLNALVVGVETECRIGNAVYPDHYDRGWHITGTAGVFGAAASAGKLLGLSEQRMIWALGLAASQPVGFRESFGSMNKSFNPGRAASNGLFAAFLASKNFTSSDQMIEAKRGWANTISTKQDYKEIVDGLGSRYESALNTYKPFACGIVMHPAIDAAIQLREQYHLDATRIESIHLRVNPLVLELTGKKAPTTGLEGKFSIYHAVAVAIVEGAAGERQFSDRAVQDPTIVHLRSCVVPVVDTTVKPSQVEMTMLLKDGRKLEKSIQHAKGSLESPMTDSDIEAKFIDLAKEILPPNQIRALIDLCWNLEKLPDASAIAKATVPV
ncbi:MmgE/PrpD family protein [Pendulispora rubella]|uniref:MmgE/PrpD family protein n=1 Tax=Pendulispora rubella TaxID=2741070 RepID=A0ABZ2L318_9BACT